MNPSTSRQTRILILLVIDVLFFFLELIVGYAVGSLALVADSFHMLNDVMSLIVGLYAIKVSGNRATAQFSYGWHRAEILAALVNGVFLLALCFSISLEAIERFFSVPEISNPKLVVIVGACGLASNILGLFLFHEHGHSHSHEHPSPKKIALPISNPEPLTSAIPTDIPTHSRHRSDSINSLYGHPVQTRASLVQAAQDIGFGRSSSPVATRRSMAQSLTNTDLGLIDEHNVIETTPASPVGNSHSRLPTTAELPESSPAAPTLVEVAHDHEHGRSQLQSHSHSHGGHSHGSMNMRALVLHVLGDALGNVGVIATGLIIWKTDWSFKYLCDPIISLVITVIIFSSAMPLVRSASFILLQGVPETVSLDDLRAHISDVRGVKSVHELHVWQLSESKLIASVHILVAKDEDYMKVARDIRRVLHEHGVHSSTIQPEHQPPSNYSSPTFCQVACPDDAPCDPDLACCPQPLSSDQDPHPRLVDL